MSIFPSSLFIAIVSVLVLTGYVSDVFDYDCSAEKKEQVAQGKTPSDKDAPHEKSACQCLCHQIFSAQVAVPVRIACGNFVTENYSFPADQFPADAVPLGIEHPPQIA